MRKFYEMLNLGEYNTLKASRNTDHGYYLVDEDSNEVLLPNKYVPENLIVDDEIEVFLYKDSEERIIATTISPKVTLNGFAALEAKNLTKFGAFFDWGLEKDLMVPVGEQAEPIEEGQFYVVYLYLDEKTQRLAGSTKILSRLERDVIELKVGQKVKLMPFEESEIGINVIVEGKYSGKLYKNEVFEEIQVGDQLEGFVKKIRDDNKIDVSLNPFGYRAVESNLDKVLEAIKENDGFLNLNDKSSPEDIHSTLGISKKLFKRSVGALYKQKRIEITDSGIKLIK